MNTATKLAAFVVVVAATFGSAMAVGSAIGPIDVSGGGDGDSAHGMTTESPDRPRGLAVAEAGYRLAVESDTITAETPSTLVFRIIDDVGVAVTSFQQLHERPLHLIVLSRNLVDYLHLHPTMDATGRWTIELPALTPGSYRVFADFQPDGADNITLGTDISVPGRLDEIAIPRAAPSATVDGYTVTLTGTPAVGEHELGFTVEFGGQTVRTDPYLGAAGHLVAIRGGDLAYLHVHPHADANTPVVTFTAEFPTAGEYRLFFDFSHDGRVRTASFTVAVPGTSDDGSMATHSEGP